MSQKLYIETVGCQMNVLDSELVVGSLRRQGYELTPDVEEADVILFNTCSVRQHAELGEVAAPLPPALSPPSPLPPGERGDDESAPPAGGLVSKGKSTAN